MNAAARALLVLTLSGSLVACQSYGGGYGYGLPDMGPKQTVGAVLGAAGGAALGSQFGSGDGQIAMTAVGTLLGAWLGSQAGQSLDRADQNYAYQAQYGALQTGRQMNWNNPQSGNYGSVTPGPAYSNYGSECRQYSHTVYIGGRPETVYGTACRQPDGSWRVANG